MMRPLGRIVSPSRLIDVYRSPAGAKAILFNLPGSGSAQPIAIIDHSNTIRIFFISVLLFSWQSTFSDTSKLILHLKMWLNFHTHSTYCDGKTDLDDLVTKARSLDIGWLGFS